MDITLFEDIPLIDVKNVFIDLDNTLYPYYPAHQVSLEACYSEFIHFKEIDQKMFNDLYRNARNQVTERLSPQGICRSRLLAFLAIFEELELAAPFSLATHFDEIYWSNFISSIKPCRSALTFLETCKTKKIPICIVSDMITNIQVKKIKALKIESYIDRLVTSEECGVEKPHPIIFETALKKMKGSLTTSIFVGDDIKKDFLGARDFGIKSYLVEAND